MNSHENDEDLNALRLVLPIIEHYHPKALADFAAASSNACLGCIE